MTRTLIDSQSTALAARKPVARLLLSSLTALMLAGSIGPARAYDFIGQTFLLNIKQGSPLSDQVYKLGLGSFELSGGGVVDFRRWYRQNWMEMRVDFMTQIAESFGILWGVSSGEWVRNIASRQASKSDSSCSRSSRR